MAPELLTNQQAKLDQSLNQQTDILLDGFNKKAAEEAPSKYKELLNKFKKQRELRASV